MMVTCRNGKSTPRRILAYRDLFDLNLRFPTQAGIARVQAQLQQYVSAYKSSSLTPSESDIMTGS